jgi:hypothetical protein
LYHLRLRGIIIVVHRIIIHVRHIIIMVEAEEAAVTDADRTN